MADRLVVLAVRLLYSLVLLVWFAAAVLRQAAANLVEWAWGARPWR